MTCRRAGSEAGTGSSSDRAVTRLQQTRHHCGAEKSACACDQYAAHASPFMRSLSPATVVLQRRSIRVGARLTRPFLDIDEIANGGGNASVPIGFFLQPRCKSDEVAVATRTADYLQPNR